MKEALSKLQERHNQKGVQNFTQLWKWDLAYKLLVQLWGCLKTSEYNSRKTNRIMKLPAGTTTQQRALHELYVMKISKYINLSVCLLVLRFKLTRFKLKRSKRSRRSRGHHNFSDAKALCKSLFCSKYINFHWQTKVWEENKRNSFWMRQLLLGELLNKGFGSIV